jgi:hypothetical protein
MHMSSSMFEVEFIVNSLYIPTEEEVIGILDARDDASDNKPIEEVGDVQINDVVHRIGFKDSKSSLVILEHVLEQRPIDVTPLIQSILTLQKEIRPWHAQESHQTTFNSFFHYA